MPLRSKYPITDWVLSRESVDIGDIVAYYDEDEGKEVHAEVRGYPSDEHRQYISVRVLGALYHHVLNFYNTITYVISRKSAVNKVCTCGAKYTSNPNYHLSYCDLYKGE